MARHDIRGVKKEDGSYALTAKDIYNINDNNMQISQQAFGTSDFTKKVEKRVEKNEEDIVELISSVDGISISIDTTTHSFTAEGYILRDSNSEALMTPNGVANEQNIGRVDNIEPNFPMKIPFHIGTEVSVISQVVFKWDLAPFRTYSKGAASGGGNTSGFGGSYSSTVGVFDWTQGLGADTDTRTIDSNNLGTPHSHFIASSKLGHRHNVVVPEHQHSTPAHIHPPEFGILQTPLLDNAVKLIIDGQHEVLLNSVRGEEDISTLLTTNGWHTIIVESGSLKRLDATVFLKTYIRR